MTSTFVTLVFAAKDWPAFKELLADLGNSWEDFDLFLYKYNFPFNATL